MKSAPLGPETITKKTLTIPALLAYRGSGKVIRSGAERLSTTYQRRAQLHAAASFAILLVNEEPTYGLNEV